jgi:hypothetical protein
MKSPWFISCVDKEENFIVSDTLLLLGTDGERDHLQNIEFSFTLWCWKGRQPLKLSSLLSLMMAVMFQPVPDMETVSSLTQDNLRPVRCLKKSAVVWNVMPYTSAEVH